MESIFTESRSQVETSETIQIFGPCSAVSGKHFI